MPTAGQLSLLRMLKILNPCQKLNSKASFFHLTHAKFSNSNKLLEQTLKPLSPCIFVTGFIQLICVCSSWTQYSICLNFERLAHFTDCDYLNKPLFVLLPCIAKCFLICNVAMTCIIYLYHHFYTMMKPKSMVVYIYDIIHYLIRKKGVRFGIIWSNCHGGPWLVDPMLYISNINMVYWLPMQSDLSSLFHNIMYQAML